jgi:hypothetical protein
MWSKFLAYKEEATK